ncbi:MAG: sigma-70 family RNA polymerase sigma factor [Myxococcota bacterium]
MNRPDAIAALVRAGDLDALDALTRTAGSRLIAVGRRYCRSDEEAHDAVQDALVSAATHLQDYRGDGSVEGWVVRMVARACGRMRRGRKNDPGLHAVDVELPSDGDPELDAERARMAEALGEVLLELDPVDRAVLLLAEAEGWTGPDIATHLGSTPAAVRQRLSRVRRKVRERLDPLVDHL